MEYLSLLLFAGVILVGVYGLTRLIGRTKRNEGSTHGGGMQGAPTDVTYGP